MKDGSEILIPKSERKEMIRLLHLTHAAPETMLLQMKSRIFWPRQRQDLETHYKECKECTENRISRPQMKNEVDMSDLFDNFFPGGRIQVDFAERGSDNFLVIVCQMSGFMQIYKCPQKSTEQALLKLREWCAQFGAPMICVSDNGPSFRNKFEEECLKMGIKVEHSSAYNSSSMSEVERAVGSLKHLLKRGMHMSQLQLSEMVFALNSRIQPNGTGSPISRFFGRDVRNCIPNSLNRSLNWEILMQNRKNVHLKRVSRKGRGTKQVYSVGESCWVQNIKTKKWDREAIITGVRTACDGTIVSYDIDIDGVKSTRHRKYLHKMNVNNIDDKDLPKNDDEERKFPLADERVYADGTARGTAGQSTVRRSPRLHLGLGAQRH